MPYSAQCERFAPRGSILNAAEAQCEAGGEFRWCPHFDDSPPCAGSTILVPPESALPNNATEGGGSGEGGSGEGGSGEGGSGEGGDGTVYAAQLQRLRDAAEHSPDYKGALRLAVTFFRAQRSGLLPEAARLPWQAQRLPLPLTLPLILCLSLSLTLTLTVAGGRGLRGRR